MRILIGTLAVLRWLVGLAFLTVLVLVAAKLLVARVSLRRLDLTVHVALDPSRAADRTEAEEEEVWVWWRNNSSITAESAAVRAEDGSASFTTRVVNTVVQTAFSERHLPNLNRIEIGLGMKTTPPSMWSVPSVLPHSFDQETATLSVVLR
jgi:hypothetical protein